MLSTSPTSSSLPSILFSTPFLPSFLSRISTFPQAAPPLISLLSSWRYRLLQRFPTKKFNFKNLFPSPFFKFPPRSPRVPMPPRGAYVGNTCQRVKGDLRLLNIHNRETYGVTIDDPLGVGPVRSSAGYNSSWTMDSGRITSSPCVDDYGLPFCGYLELNRIS